LNKFGNDFIKIAESLIKWTQSINQLKILAGLLNFVYSFKVFELTLRPSQIKEELLKLLELLKDMV
jgi:hypothetical protein